MDVCSGAVHSVDDIAYDAIELYESTPKDELCALLLQKYGVSEDEINECYEQIE